MYVHALVELFYRLSLEYLLAQHLNCSETGVRKSEMFRIELHNGIQRIKEGYHRLGYWHRGDEITVKQTGINIFYSINFLMFPISLMPWCHGQ